MMPSMQKGNCSWSLLAAVGILLVLFSVVHLFLFPLGPTLDCFGVRQAQTSCVPTYESTREIGSVQHNVELDLDHQFPADLHIAVVYRGTPWKAEIGRWLSGCDAIVEEIHITEKISGKACRNDCSGQGVCNYELGQCRCFHGFSDLKLEFQCRLTGANLIWMYLPQILVCQAGVMWTQKKALLER